VDGIGKDDVTAAQSLRTLLHDYPQTLGTATEKAAAADAYKTFQATFVKKKLLGKGLDKLPEILDAQTGMDPRVLDAVFGGTAEGKQVLSSAYSLADTIKRIETEGIKVTGKEAALTNLADLDEVIKNSAVAKVGDATGYRSIYGLGAVGYALSKAIKIPATLATGELAAGFTAWALHRPEAAKALVDGLRGFRGFTRGTARGTSAELASLFTQYLAEEGKKRRDFEPWKFLQPPTVGKVIPPGLQPPPLLR